MLTFATCGAFADTTFYENMSNGFSTNRCDANTPTCGGSGWIIYDDFTVAGQTSLTDFTYTDFFFTGSIANYVSTNWYVFGPNASNPFGAPTYSGTSVASFVANNDGSYTFSVSGLNLALSDGTWIIGFSNNMNDPSVITTRAASDDPRLPGYWQQSTDGVNQFTLSGNTAFSVSTSGNGVPEPGTLVMFGSGLVGLAGMIRRKIL